VLSTSLYALDSDPEYTLLQNIPYYTEQPGQRDEYLDTQCRLDLYYPTHIKNFATVIWFHGGGLKGGERYIPTGLRERGKAIVPVGYRLYPKVSFPAYLEDAAAAVAWVFNHITEYGGNVDCIFVSGHSAGGYLSSMIGLDQRWLRMFDIECNRIVGLIPFSGYTITHFTIREEMGIPNHQLIIDEYAPLYHVRPDASPLLLITGDRDLELLGRYEENAYMARMMEFAGHRSMILNELDGFDHGAMVEPAILLLLKFIDRICSRS
jgi:hypothetical protein